MGQPVLQVGVSKVLKMDNLIEGLLPTRARTRCIAIVGFESGWTIAEGDRVVFNIGSCEGVSVGCH